MIGIKTEKRYMSDPGMFIKLEGSHRDVTESTNWKMELSANGKHKAESVQKIVSTIELMEKYLKQAKENIKSI